MHSAVKYKARLEDGTIISKSDGVEFIVEEGQSHSLSNSIFFLDHNVGF